MMPETDLTALDDLAEATARALYDDDIEHLRRAGRPIPAAWDDLLAWERQNWTRRSRRHLAAAAPILATSEAEAARLARQLHSIADLCDQARFGLVRTAAIYQLLITDPADEE